MKYLPIVGLIAALGLVVAGVALYSIPAGLIAAGVAVGAVSLLFVDFGDT